MELRPDIDEVMERTTRFWSDTRAGSALVTVNVPCRGHSVKGLNEWQFPAEMEAFLDETIRALQSAWQKRKSLPDDSIPSLYPRYGIAEHSAFAARDVAVDFSAHTSWPHPVLQDCIDLDRLTLEEDNPWLRLVIDGLSYLKEQSRGRYAVRLRGVMAPMDLANALRGNEIFEDIYECPEELHRLLSFCVKAGAWFISHQKQVVGSFHGGTLIGPGLWTPGNSIGHLSEDASVLCSPETYREFGKPYTEQLVAPYDSANMHLHTAGAHAFEPITAIRKLQSFELAPDPKQPRGIEVYRNHFDLFEGRVMRLFITFDEIRGNLDLLKQARTILNCNAGSMEEAQAIVEFVRQELPV